MDIVLEAGYTDPQKVEHRNVTLGKRLNGATLFALDEDPRSDIPTQFQLLTVRSTITAFGSLDMPVQLEVLLKLDGTEIDDLISAHNKFMAEGLEGRAPEILSDNQVKLAFGYESEGLTYTRVEFGHRLNGYDRVEADKTGYKTLKREYLLIGREITKLSTDDGQYTLDGPVEIQMFEKLDGVDFVTLRVAAIRWRESFRAINRAVQKDAPGRRAAAGSENSLEPK